MKLHPAFVRVPGSVLTGWVDPEGEPDAIQLMEAIRRASRGEWRAAAWVLEHHPAFREDFGDVAHDQRIRRELMARVCRAIAATGLPPELERAVLLQLVAHGCPGNADGSDGV